MSRRLEALTVEANGRGVVLGAQPKKNDNKRTAKATGDPAKATLELQARARSCSNTVTASRCGWAIFCVIVFAVVG